MRKLVGTWFGGAPVLTDARLDAFIGSQGGMLMDTHGILDGPPIAVDEDAFREPIRALTEALSKFPRIRGHRLAYDVTRDGDTVHLTNIRYEPFAPEDY